MAIGAQARQATIITFDVTTSVNVLRGQAAGAPASGMHATTIGFKADTANASLVRVGAGGSASFPLLKNESVILDALPGYYFDLSDITIDGNAVASLVVHVIAVVVTNA